MPKLKNPPQGGEKYLCLTLFCTMFLAVVSAVGIIYSIVIVYVPAKKVLESNLDGPKMCTTLSLQKDLDSVELCEDWTSCHEWCLSKVSGFYFQINQTTYNQPRTLLLLSSNRKNKLLLSITSTDPVTVIFHHSQI